MTVALTHHAAQRVAEFGVDLDVVEAVATRPDVSHTNTAGERVCVSDRHPQWTVVLGDDDVVITVLRRMQERWEHGDPARDLIASPSPTAGGEADRPDARPARRPAQRRPAPVRQVPAAVTTTRISPATMASAVELAGGDLRRLVLNDDGSVTVLNRPRGSQPPRTGVSR